MTDKESEERQEAREIVEMLLKHYKSYKGSHFENLDKELSYWIEKAKD